MSPAEQKAAIRKLMANRRREIMDTSSGSYPKFKPGMTTADYIRLFSIGRPNVLPFGPVTYHPNHGKRVDLSAFERPAPYETQEA